MSNYVPIEIILILSNVIFFMVVQILFFKTIASKQVDEVVKKKSHILSDMLDNNFILSNDFNTYYTSDSYKKTKETAHEQSKKREHLNNTLIIDEICPIIRYALYILLFFMFYHLSFSCSENSIQKRYVDVFLGVLAILITFAYIGSRKDEKDNFYTVFFSKCLVSSLSELIILILAIMITVVFMYTAKSLDIITGHKWSQKHHQKIEVHHWIILSLVVFAYAAEILFYLFILRQYEFYPDQEMYNIFVDAARDGMYRPKQNCKNNIPAPMI